MSFIKGYGMEAERHHTFGILPRKVGSSKNKESHDCIVEKLNREISSAPIHLSDDRLY